VWARGLSALGGGAVARLKIFLNTKVVMPTPGNYLSKVIKELLRHSNCFHCIYFFVGPESRRSSGF
jgi:hypothetical protein